VKDRVRLGSLRKLSIEMIARNGVASDAATPLLERSYKEGIDMEERLGAVQALAAVNTDGAARSLSSFLMILNGKRKSGNITRTTSGWCAR
jgi:20S proteasome alpha/beta subunit